MIRRESCVIVRVRPGQTEVAGACQMSSGWRHVKSRYPHDTLAPVPARHFPAGLAGGVDPVGFASGVGERSVGFDRIVFCGVDSEQLPVL